MVVALGDGDAGSHEPDRQEVPLDHGVLIAAEHHRDIEPEAPRRRRGEAGVVRLAGADRDDRVGTLNQGASQFEVQFAGLVTAQGDRGQIIPFEPELDSQGIAQVGQRIQRRGIGDEAGPGKGRQPILQYPGLVLIHSLRPPEGSLRSLG